MIEPHGKLGPLHYAPSKGNQCSGALWLCSHGLGGPQPLPTTLGNLSSCYLWPWGPSSLLFPPFFHLCDARVNPECQEIALLESHFHSLKVSP